MNRRDDLENAVGFDEDVDILMRMLRNDEMFFVSIIGESGAGKNTLAKIIRRVMGTGPEIELILWYHIEPGCSVEDVIRHMTADVKAYKGRYHAHPWPNDQYKTLKSIRGTSKDIRGDFLRALAGRRYLFIVGGISSKTMLNTLRAFLPRTNSGSLVMLILDTENEEIGRHANTMNMNGINGVHVLSRLDQGRSGKLFFWKVLRKGQPIEGSINIISKDSEYLRLVYDITGGYPIAIVLLAGLLRFKEKPAQWDAVLQQLKSECETQDNTEGGSLINQQASTCGTRRAMEIVFWASFEHLSDDLKSCLLYFACYPRTYSYSADMIVRMWIAEGLIKKPEDGKTMEEVGNDYLKELVLRCLVEVDEMEACGGIKLVRVHNSIMGLLRSEVREAGFMEIHNTDDTRILPSVRRLSVQSCDSSRYTSTFASKKLPKLRSFICHIMIIQGEEQELKFLRSSRFIRVISIQGLNIEKLPGKIGDLINLRYLRIDSERLHKIPCSIARLLNLQTLDIRNTSVSKIEKDFWKIKTLRHVLAGCLTLPVKVGGGSELQTLHGVKPDDSAEWSEGNCPLDNMTNLRSLEMYEFIYARHGMTGFRSALKKMHFLCHLRIEGDEIPSYILSHPNLVSLQTMILYGSVKWDNVIKELPAVDRALRIVRPNLVQLRLKRDAISEVPQSISEQLEGILIEAEE
jgi:hypothetical protein